MALISVNIKDKFDVLYTLYWLHYNSEAKIYFLFHYFITFSSALQIQINTIK